MIELRRLARCTVFIGDLSAPVQFAFEDLQLEMHSGKVGGNAAMEQVCEIRSIHTKK